MGEVPGLMGAWDTAPFGNDDAADWRYLLLDGGGPGVVAAALREVRGGEAPAEARAVAAAALVGAALDVEVELPDDMRDWMSTADSVALRALAGEAVASLDRVLVGSELQQLWDEAGDDTWQVDTLRLREGIAAASA
jgi:hypothetical protein